MQKRLLQIVTVFTIGIVMLVAMSGAAMAEQEGDFTYTVSDGKATITGYTGPGGDVVIPETLGGCPVAAIGDSTFWNCQVLTGIVIPDGVLTIGNKAFYSCYTLSSVDLPASIQTIGNQSFEFCAVLSEITIPENVTSIGNKAFHGCDLTSLDMPDSVISVGYEAFAGNYRLSSVNLSNNLREISVCMFQSCYSLNSITLPDSIESIGGYAFNDCNLKSLTIPSSVRSLGGLFLWQNSGLHTVEIMPGLTEISDSAFKGSEITNIALPDTVRYIRDNAFAGCPLSAIIIPDGVVEIGSEAFSGCSQLKNITIPDSIESIGYRAFANSGLTSIDIQNILSLGDGVFLNCFDMETISLPPMLDHIGSFTFSNCRSLVNIMIPDSISILGMDAFQGCTLLKEVTLNGVTVIGNDAFRNCTGLEKVNVTDNLVQINPYAFAGCLKLKTFAIPGSVPRIYNNAFYNCISLTDITIDNGVQRINDEAFKGCSAISSIIFPESVIRVYTQAFESCSSLKSVLFYGDKPELDYGVFADVNSSFMLYYHVSKSSTWSSFSDYPKQAFCTLTLDPNDGNAASVGIQYLVNGRFVEPASPVRLGFCFGGWYKESTCINKWEFNSDMADDDTTLYARWIDESSVFTVTFNPQGGTAVAPKTAQYNTTITAPTPPTRAGYVFQGWYKEASCTNAWNFSTDKVTANITLYAKWVSATPAAVKAVSASYTGIKITWNAVPAAAGYQVYYATSSAGPWSLKGTVTTPTYSCTSLVTGKYYYFKVRSYNAAKTYSAFSAVVSTRPIPATPYSVKAARASSTSIKITWGAISGATRYEVWRSTSSTGTYTLAGTTSSLYYINSRLTAGRTYYFKVRCYHLEGSTKVYSAWSAVVSAKP